MKNILKIISTLMFVVPVAVLFAVILDKIILFDSVPDNFVFLYSTFFTVLYVCLNAILDMKFKNDLEIEKLYGFDREISRAEIEKYLKELNLDASDFNFSRILVTADETKSDLEIVKHIYEYDKKLKEEQENE